MAGSKMHDGEVHIDVGLVRRLVAQQFPHWSGLIVEPADSTGTVNTIYRLGSDMYLRLPRVEAWAQDLVKELQWLPSLAGYLSLEIPEPLAEGHPAFGYPFEWAIYRWLDGSTYAPDSIGSERDAAAELARFVSELHAIDSSGGPRSRRDAPLRLRDSQVQAFIQSLDGEIDGQAAMAAWRRSLKAPEWDQVSIWTHGDLLPPNLLVRDGRISAVVDFGSIGLGDPAVDVIPAWTVFGEEGRKTFHASLDVDDDAWTRATRPNRRVAC